MRPIETTCCVVGGGPAGMMLGVLLARSGIETVILEKHADFLRDFRGDTVHPSTMDLLLPSPLAALLRLSAPLLRRLVARVVGLGVRPEHVRTLEA